MNKKTDPALADAENPEWGLEEFAAAKRLHEMPPEFQAGLDPIARTVGDLVLKSG